MIFMINPGRIALIKGISKLLGLLMTLSVLNLPVAVVGVIGSLTWPPLREYEDQMSLYGLVSSLASLGFTALFLSAESLLSLLELRRSRLRIEMEACLTVLDAPPSTPEAMPFAACCLRCQYFSGTTAYIRCAVNPVGDPQLCNHWKN